MKKLLFKLIAVISLVAVTFGTLAGCALFETNKDRDMAQKAVTVDISAGAEKGVATDILKRDLIAGYMSYGYYYVQNYGYTTAKAYQLVLDNLVNNAVIIQQSKKELAGDYKSKVYVDDVKVLTAGDVEALENGAEMLSLIASDNDIAAYTAKKVGETGYAAGLADYVKSVYGSTDLKRTDASFRFIGDVNEVLKAVSDAIDNLNSFIKSFMDEDDHEHNHDEITYSPRTTPTMDKEEDKIDVEACYKVIKDDQTGLKAEITGDRLKAFKKGYKRLQELGVVETDSNNDKYFEGKEVPTVLSALQLDYFKNSVQSALDSKAVDKYEKALRADRVATADELWKEYQDLGEKQSSEYAGNVSGLETALGEVSDSKFVVYNSGIGYGYVSHLVVEYTEAQKALITEKKAEKDITKTEIADYVKTLAGGIVAKDLRDSWVKAGYGNYDAESGEFVFSDKYVYNTSDKEWNLAKFNGTVGGVTTYEEETNDGTVVKLRFENVTANELGYKDFVGIVEGALGVAPVLDEAVVIPDFAAKKYDERKEILNRFEDIKFAFSTDTGNFNKYLGYVYSPLTSKNQYVPEFVDACAKALEKGEGGVVMFMSESYGLHILICTAKEGNYGYYDTLEAFKSDMEIKGTVAYNFKKANASLIESNYVSKEADRFIKEYTNKNKDGKYDYITYNEKAYKDLVTE